MYARLQNHQFQGPAFHWTHCQINNFQAQIFCVPGHKIINFWALLFFVPGCKISNFQATDFIELGAQLAISCLPSCKINIFPMQFFLCQAAKSTIFAAPTFYCTSTKINNFWARIFFMASVTMFSFLLCFTCTFHYSFTPVWSLFGLHLPIYICLSFTFFEAVHLTQSSCLTMMTPSLFLTLYDSLLCINTWEIVSSTLTRSWEIYLIFSSLSNLAS